MAPESFPHDRQSRKGHRSGLLQSIAALVAASFLAGSSPAASAELVSRRPASLPPSITASRGSGPARWPISADGRFVAFSSAGPDVVASPPDANQQSDTFVRDLQGGSTTLVSVNADGTGTANLPSWPVAISADGRYVLFGSAASDLVAGDANNRTDVFVRDLLLGTTALVSVAAPGGGSGNGSSTAVAMSPNGRFILFTSWASNLVANDANGSVGDAFVRDLQTDSTTLASLSTGWSSGNASSAAVAISSDGRYVIFESSASNFVATDTNNTGDVFRRDLQTGTTELVSVNKDGTDTGNNFSLAVSTSASGRFVLFWSLATDLVATPDENGGVDVYLRDLEADVTMLATVNAAGTATAAGDNWPSAMSDDGRYVAFRSNASDLVAGDAGGLDVFVRDLQTNFTSLVSVDSSGIKGNADSDIAFQSPGPAMSADGRFVLFTSGASNLAAGDGNDADDVFLRDRQLGTTSLVSAALDGQAGNGGSYAGALTADGSHAVLASSATDLVVGDDLNANWDVFVRRLQGATTELVSARATVPPSSSGNGSSWYLNGAISGDGRYVVFTSFAEDLVGGNGNGGYDGGMDAFVRDLQTGITTSASVNVAGAATAPYMESRALGVSLHGRYVLFHSYADDLVEPGIDDNDDFDLFVRDVQAGTTELVSATPSGASGDGHTFYDYAAMTPSGRYVAFASTASDLTAGDGNQTTDAFVRDLEANVTELVSVDLTGSGSGDRASGPVALTPNGRYVLFVSSAGDLVSIPSAAGVMQVYVRDRQLGTTALVSVKADGTAGSDGGAMGSAISSDGRYVLFESFASDLVAGDTNETNDVFVRDLQMGTTSLVSGNGAGTGSGNDHSTPYALSADGRYVLFGSLASDVVPNDVNGHVADVFRRDLRTGSTILVSVNAAGTGSGNSVSSYGSMSSDGLLVTFSSLANDLVSGDVNAAPDVFVRDLQAGTTVLVSTNAAGEAPGNGGSYPSVIAGGGTRVVFISDASDLVSNDANEVIDVFSAETGRAPPALPFADGFESGDVTAWAEVQP